MSVRTFRVCLAIRFYGLLTSLAMFLCSACSPSGENPSPFDIQKGSASPYAVEANWVCVDEENAKRFACPQRVLRANADNVIWTSYTNVGRATLPVQGVLIKIWIDEKIVYRGRNDRSMNPGREQTSYKPPRIFRQAVKEPGTYEVMLEVSLLQKFEEANTDDNVVVQMVEVRD